MSSKATVPVEATPRPARQVLASRDFGPYFLGNLTSSVGTWFQNLAAALLVFRLTESTLLVGVVNFSQFLGALVLAPWAGAAADRFDRRKLLLVSQSVAFLVTGGLALVTLAGAASALVVIVAAVVLGLSLAFYVPAMLSLVPLLVPKPDLDAALSLNSVTFNLARAIGPVLAALVIERYGIGPAFGINALTFLVLIVALLVVRPRPQTLATGPRPRLRESFHLVRADERLTAFMFVVMAASISTDPINTLTPEFATRVLGLADTVTGVLIGGFGAGATVTALFLTGWLRRRERTLVMALTVQGVGMLVFAVAPNLAVALVGMALSGAGFLGAITRATTRIQNLVADDQLGRVMALWSLAFIGTRPLAALLDGVVADLFGARTAAVMMALPALGAALYIRQLIRRIDARAADTDDDADDPATGPEAAARS